MYVFPTRVATSSRPAACFVAIRRLRFAMRLNTAHCTHCCYRSEIHADGPFCQQLKERNGSS